MLRIVLDTNVAVSAIINNGKPRKLLWLGISGKYQILMSKEILDEVSEVLQRPKFKMTGDDIMRIILALVESSEEVQIRSHFQVITNDPDDNTIVSTAYDGNADYIVSGDKDLLDLENFRNIRIVTVDKMLKTVQ